MTPIRADSAPPVQNHPSIESAGRSVADFASGGPEHVIAEAALELDEASERTSEVSRRSRRAQRRSQRAALAEKRKAAKLELAAGLTQSVSQAATSAASIAQNASASQSGDATARSDQRAMPGDDIPSSTTGPDAPESLLSSFGQVAQSGTTAVVSGLTYASKRHGIQSEQLNQSAAAHGDSTEEAEETRKSMQRFADKALQHLSEIAETKQRALLASLRG